MMGSKSNLIRASLVAYFLNLSMRNLSTYMGRVKTVDFYSSHFLAVFKQL